METSFYIPGLTDAQIAQLNQLLENNEIPNWDEYNIPVKFRIQLESIFNDNKYKKLNVSPGNFKPMPTKAPPPRYVKNGDIFIEIKHNWLVSNGVETLYDNNFYAFNVIAIPQNQVTLQVFYNLNGYIIESIIEEDILFDAHNENSDGLVQNLMLVIKLSPGNNQSQGFYQKTLNFNPTRISLVPKINYTSILSEVLNQLSFHLYKLS